MVSPGKIESLSDLDDQKKRALSALLLTVALLIITSRAVTYRTHAPRHHSNMWRHALYQYQRTVRGGFAFKPDLSPSAGGNSSTIELQLRTATQPSYLRTRRELQFHYLQAHSVVFRA